MFASFPASASVQCGAGHVDRMDDFAVAGNDWCRVGESVLGPAQSVQRRVILALQLLVHCRFGRWFVYCLELLDGAFWNLLLTVT